MCLCMWPEVLTATMGDTCQKGGGACAHMCQPAMAWHVVDTGMAAQAPIQPGKALEVAVQALG